jgi:hypothetical protein
MTILLLLGYMHVSKKGLLSIYTAFFFFFLLLFDCRGKDCCVVEYGTAWSIGWPLHIDTDCLYDYFFFMSLYYLPFNLVVFDPIQYQKFLGSTDFNACAVMFWYIFKQILAHSRQMTPGGLA